jgi:hypothetical protein
MSVQREHRTGLFGGIATFLEFASGEYILTRLNQSNGGTVVFLRALQISLLTYFAGIGVMNWLDPMRTPVFSGTEFRLQVIDNAKWLGALFGGSYAALYARFSSQWAYLANVYNQMKSAQARRDCDPIVLAEWRAGFIEDCAELHLVRKPMFASIVAGILSDDAPGVETVRTIFDKHTPGGRARRDRIFAEVNAVVERIGREYAQ